MNYYIYTCDTDHYDSLILDESISDIHLLCFNGTPLAEEWSPLPVKLYKMKYRGNFFGLRSHVPVFDERALEAIGPTIENFVEILPLSHNEPDLAKIYAIHVLPILDCLDFNRADVRRFNDGRLMSVWKYAFLEEVIGETPIFRIKDLVLNYVFVSDIFKDAVDVAELKGLLFKSL